MSREINTLVFFDLETTGLKGEGSKYPRIIELFMLAIGRSQFLTPEKPRVLNSLRLAFYPNKPIPLNTSCITGLYNDALEDQANFDSETIELINKFLSRLKKPVCLLAHNGYQFDFDLLQHQLLQNKMDLLPDLLCADTLLAFQSIEQTRYLHTRYQASSPSKCALFQLHTPPRQNSTPIASNPSKKPVALSHRDKISRGSRTVKRKLWPNDTKMAKTTFSNANPDDINVDTTVTTATPVSNGHESNQDPNFELDLLENATEITSPKSTRLSYKLTEIYKREFTDVKISAHCAEDDVMMMFDIAFKWNKQFLDWLDKYAVKF